jgi:hypothetical protein
MGLFGNPKIKGDELKQCLAYFEESSQVLAFQTKEADIYNNAMVKYNDSITKDPLAANEAKKSAKRLFQAATEALKRHNAIKNIPSLASQTHYSWFVTLSANVTWASATNAAIEVLASGMSPNYVYLQKLVNEYQKAFQNSKKEDLKFIKLLKVNSNEIINIVTRASSSSSEDN